MSALIAHIFTRSFSYIMYRYSGGNIENWPKLPEQFLKLILFILVVSGLSIAESNWSIVLGWQTLAFLLWFLIRSKNQTLKIISQFKLISQDGAN